MQNLLTRLLTADPQPLADDNVAAWWRRTAAERSLTPVSIEQAVLAGFRADRVGYAYVGGYEAALHALVPALPANAVASFCLTEPGGNLPRAIATRLMLQPEGGLILSGAKRWIPAGPLADVLLVIAAERVDTAGRPQLRMVLIDTAQAGVRLGAMPPPPFMPEIPYGDIVFESVAVEDTALLPGDGWDRYAKPFSAVEDLHVHAALLGYLISIARRFDWPTAVIERAVAALASTITLATLDPSASETHIALAGLQAQDAWLFGEHEWWANVEPDERARWQRDRALFNLGGKVREARRQRGWEILAAAQPREVAG